MQNRQPAVHGSREKFLEKFRCKFPRADDAKRPAADDERRCDEFDFSPAADVKTMDDKNVPTALIEIIGANGSLGDWVVSDWTSDDAMIGELAGLCMQGKIGRGIWLKNCRASWSNRSQLSTGGKKFTFAMRPEQVRHPFSAEAAEGDAHGLCGHRHSEGFSQPRAVAQSADRRKPRGGNFHESSLALRRADVLSISDGRRRRRRSRPGAMPSSVLQVVRNPAWLTPYLGCAHGRRSGW